MKAMKIFFITEIILIGALTSTVFAGIYIPEFLPRPWHRLLHLFGAILFFGNIIIAALWLGLAEASRSGTTFQFAVKMINLTDLVFTGPGLILLLLNGSVLAANYGDISQVPWLKWALIWFSAAGGVWTIALIPMQFKLIRFSENQEFPWNDSASGQKMGIFLHTYYALGSLTIFFVFLSFGLMVLK